MSAITDLRERFKIEAQIQDSECIPDPLVQQWISDAILAHNSSYDSEGTDLPAREIVLVFLLAKISLCEFRAQTYVNQNDLRGTDGYGQDRNTPFAKNMAFMKSLQDRYIAKCEQMGVVPNPDLSANDVIQGKLTMVDYNLGVRVPYTNDPTPVQAIVLSSETPDYSSVVLNWTRSKDETFTSYQLYSDNSSNTPIYADWAYTSILAPRINPLSYVLPNLIEAKITSVKVINLQPATVYHFLLVVINAERRYVYSNEIIVTTAALPNGQSAPTASPTFQQ